MLKVLIADSHPLVRKALKQRIQEKISEAVIGEATDGLEVLEIVRQQPWDVLVLDISLPALSGLKVLHELGQIKPRLPALVMSEYPEPVVAIRTLKEGAAGYIRKDLALDEIVPAIQTIAQGETYISLAVKEALLAGSVNPKPLYE